MPKRTVAILAKLRGRVPTEWAGSLPVLPLQIYLILLALAVVLPTLLFSGYLLTRFAAQDREQYEQRLRYAAQDLAQNIDRDLEGIKTTLKTLAVSRPLANADFAEFHRQANEALGGSGLIILVLDRNLQQLVNTGVPFGTPLPKTGDSETGLKVLESKQPQVSDLFVGRITRKPAVDVHMPMMRNGEVRYILIMSFTPERALNLLQALRLPKGWTTTLSDGKGKVIARSELHERFVNTALPAKLLARRRDSTVFATSNLEGAPVLRAAAPLNQADWFAAVTVPMAMAEASTRGSVKLAIASGIGLLLLSVAIAIGIGRLLATPITALAEDARALGEDAPVKAMNSPIKEVNEVSEALYFASVELEDRAFTNAKLAAIVRSSQDAIVAFGLDRRIQAWNAGAERMFGYTSEQAVGQLYTMLVPAERRDEADQLASRVQAGEPMVSIETERMRKDGTVFPAHVTISPVTASDARLLAFSALLIDISARRAMEKQRDLLSHELLHRVKNTFAVVQAIARQTFKGGQELAIFLGRLNALAAAHDVLTRSNWEGGELGALARNQLASYLAGPAPAVTLSGPEVTLPREMAVPMGLVLHELATNAGKYGALSQPGGSVEVTWGVEPLESGTQVRLTWRERGGPTLDGSPKQDGFGTMLIEQSLPGAQIERRFERDGFICTIKLMLDSNEEHQAQESTSS